MPKQQPIAQPATPRLYLVTPEIDDAQSFARELAAALGAADIAAVLLRLKKADERALINRVKILAPVVQKLDTALVLDGLPDIVARGGAGPVDHANVRERNHRRVHLDELAEIGRLLRRQRAGQAKDENERFAHGE